MGKPLIVEPVVSGTDAPDMLRGLLAARHSCRGFLPRPVDHATLEKIFETPQRTSSWCNSQVWQVSVTSGAATDRLRTALLAAVDSGQPGASDFPFPAEYRGVYLERRRDCGFQLYNAVGVARRDKEGYARQGRENYRLFGAPHVAVLTSDPGLGVYGAVDVGGYVQVLLLAMQAHGVAAIPQAALTRYSALVKSMLDIPAERLMVCGISFGYEDETHPANTFRTRRASLDEAVSWVDA